MEACQEILVLYLQHPDACFHRPRVGSRLADLLIAVNRYCNLNLT